MSVGAFFDKIIMIGFGVYCIYLSNSQKEKLGNKAKLMKWAGIVMVVCGGLLTIAVFFK